MALTREFEAFALELLAGLGALRSKRMFGGAALYAGEVLFALADDDAIWIKVDDAVEPLFVAEGPPLLSYSSKAGEVMTMPYRRLPETALDDPDEAVRWAKLGVEAAIRKKAAPKKKARKS